ncbi:DUF5928 domain-containing protein [Puniceibacterium sp. IMCC21224]|uniref:DUF5928 domain-containing protein n=1 Tax=Puniceibacterium sp. IMCC21224 TaxID=1618204 RepID=UPI00064DEF6A|nr:DUF5928 domain-containing protein [Puniceibacterium sp. IMCC21224]KMK65369.1 putative N-acetylglucosaminyltransferase [Puniceibacterium sp. IMCC21224]
MAKIAFILLCHKDPDAIIKQAQSLTAVGDYIAIHFDRRASSVQYNKIRSALTDNPNVVFVSNRVRCGWGEWSLVQATLNAVHAAVEAFPRATHFYMLSGDCMTIKSAEYTHDLLDRRDVDYIESVDYFASDWIKTGWKDERLIYRHWFNERTQKRRFYAMFEVQKRLGLTRNIPADLEIMIGSQWWCLRRETVQSILEFCARRRDVTRFFAATWIPDETFFQTLVRHLVPEPEIESRTLTFLMFSDYGMPVTFYNDHYDLLLAQEYLFARKISPDAKELKRRLGVLYASEGQTFQISDEGCSLFTYMTGRGRDGRRFGTRFWEAENVLGRERELLLVICKKWQVAKRLVERIRQVSDVPCVDYLFNEEDTVLPNLGGIQSTVAKRHGHRRALIRMLFEYYDSDQLVICLDPANVDLMDDFCRDRAKTRLLEVECEFSDAFLIGHAMRAGLVGDHASKETLARLLPTIRQDITYESNRIRDAAFDNHARLRETDPPEVNAQQIAGFLSVSQDKAMEIAQTDNLFAD